MRLSEIAFAFILCLGISPCGLPVSGQTPGDAGRIQGVVTSLAGERLNAIAPVSFGADAVPGQPVISINASERLQTMRGFGATFAEAGLMTLNRLPKQRQEAVLRALFDPKTGAGLSVMKSPIAGFDFSSDGLWYTYADVPGDTELKHFSIARDLRPNGLITFIKRARRHGVFQLQATMDYPPDWMMDAKTNVRSEYYPALAQYFIKYLRAYREQGVNVDFLSPFNEPFHIYCKISYPKIREFIKGHLGPALRDSGLEVRLQTPGAHERLPAEKDFPVLLDDPETRQYISGMDLHGYAWIKQGSASMRRMHERYPDLELWQGEVCHTLHNTKRPNPIYDFGDGEFWGRMIMADIQNWASAWIYWNTILDQRGGPWLVDLAHANYDNNSQHPVVIVNTETGKVDYTGLYYYLAHFSRFVRPGAVRVATTGKVEFAEYVAFDGPEGERVLVFLNYNSERRQFVLRDGSRSAALAVPAHGIATFVWSVK